MHVDYVDLAGQEQVYDLDEREREKNEECNETADSMALYERNAQSQLIAGETPRGGPLPQYVLMSRVQEQDLVLLPL